MNKDFAHAAVSEGTVPPVSYDKMRTKKEETPVVLRGIMKKGLRD